MTDIARGVAERNISLRDEYKLILHKVPSYNYYIRIEKFKKIEYALKTNCEGFWEAKNAFGRPQVKFGLHSTRMQWEVKL